MDSGLRCLHNGTCVDLVGGFRCNCPPGYTGLHCEADINECRPGACHAAHTRDCLQDPGGHFRCLCHPGFTGPRCQTALSPCESQPCQHGGQCHPSSGPGGGLTFTCHCVQVGVSDRGGGSWGRRGGVASGKGMVYKGKVEGKGILRDAELWFGE